MYAGRIIVSDILGVEVSLEFSDPYVMLLCSCDAPVLMCMCSLGIPGVHDASLQFNQALQHQRRGHCHAERAERPPGAHHCDGVFGAAPHGNGAPALLCGTGPPFSFTTFTLLLLQPRSQPCFLTCALSEHTMFTPRAPCVHHEWEREESDERHPSRRTG